MILNITMGGSRKSPQPKVCVNNGQLSLRTQPRVAHANHLDQCQCILINVGVYMGRKQENAYLPNILVISRVTSNPSCEFNFKHIFTKPSGNV